VSRFVVFRPSVIVSVIVSPDTISTSLDVAGVFAVLRASVSRAFKPNAADYPPVEDPVEHPPGREPGREARREAGREAGRSYRKNYRKKLQEKLQQDDG
jgi:hypothetical protein